MKTVEVKDQIRLPLRRCLELVLSGVKYRLFRAGITVVIVALAVAFLMTMLSEGLISGNVAQAISTRIGPRQTFLFWVSRLSVPLTEQQLSEELAGAQAGGARWRELATWGGLDDATMAKLTDVARRQERYVTFFVELSPGNRRVLLGRTRGEEIFAALADPSAQDDFERKLREQVGKALPGTMGEFRGFLDDWQATRPARRKSIAGHEEALRQVRDLLNGRAVNVFLAEADVRLPTQLANFGFRMTPEEVQTVRERGSFSVDAERLVRTLGVPIVKKELATRRGEELVDVNAESLFREVSSSSGAEWLADLAARARGIKTLGIPPERIEQVAKNHLGTGGPAKTIEGWLKTFATPLAAEAVAEQLAATEKNSPTWKRLQGWGKLTTAEMARLGSQAKARKAWMDFFAELSAEQRKDLFGEAEAAAILDLLADETKFKAAAQKLTEAGKKLPRDATAKDVAKLVADWKATGPLRKKIADGSAKAVASVKDVVSRDALLRQDKAALDALKANGFGLDADQRATLREFNAMEAEVRQIESMLTSRLLKQRLASLRKAQPDQADAKMLFEELSADKAHGANWLLRLIKDAQGLGPMDLPPVRIAEVAETRLEQRDLAAAEAEVKQSGMGSTEGGFSSRAMWLIIVSFIVCFVGILNAMFMSVTERYREIATMKCLGARDGFIMVHFILESCIHGITGGLIGVVLGFVLGSLRSTATYGWMALEQIAAGEILAAAGISIVVGLTLSAVCAMLPAWWAARLAPMEAMRIE